MSNGSGLVASSRPISVERRLEFLPQALVAPGRFERLFECGLGRRIAVQPQHRARLRPAPREALQQQFQNALVAHTQTCQRERHVRPHRGSRPAATAASPPMSAPRSTNASVRSSGKEYSAIRATSARNGSAAGVCKVPRELEQHPVDFHAVVLARFLQKLEEIRENALAALEDRAQKTMVQRNIAARRLAQQLANRRARILLGTKDHKRTRSLFLPNHVDRDLHGDIAMQPDRHLVLAQLPDRLLQLDLLAIDGIALRFRAPRQCRWTVTEPNS